MQTQIDYLNNLAAEYRIYSEHPEQLYTALNQITSDALREINSDFGDTERKYQPVRLLRATAARYLLEGHELTKAVVEEIKEKIRSKDTDSFSYLPPDFLSEFENYAESRRDLFANWQRDWSVFHPFFYRGVTRETTQLYLEQISKQLIKDLGLADYTFHTVDFYGPSNFGAVHCWLALFPQNKPSHKDSHQFFLKFKGETEVGRVSGSNLNDGEDLKIVQSYEEALQFLTELKPAIVRANDQIRNYFKYSPGEHASRWEEFYQQGIAATNYSTLPLADISAVSSHAELNIAAGLPEDSQSNLTWCLWLFKNANKGDVIFAAQGTMNCIGVGVITGDYYFDSDAEDFQHRRSVEWITDKVYHYQRYALERYPRLFRTDAFSPTLVHQFLLSEYVRLFPELAAVFDRYSLHYEAPSVESHASEIEDGQDEPNESNEVNYWWLVANPSIWTFSKYEVGGRQTYTSKNDAGNKRRIFKNFAEAKPGDLVIGYESSPVKQIKAICEITRPLHQTEGGRDVIELEINEKLEVPVYLNELQDNRLLTDSEPILNNLQGSLFRLTEDQFDLIREIIADKNVGQEVKLSRDIRPYKFTEDSERPFISEQGFQQTIALLKRKNNIILEGPPGVGKTFIARKLAYEIMGQINDAQIEMVQFHQSFAYEDFIQGFRPSKGSFVLKNGIFYTFCQQALAHPERPFFFIIDEINRGNLSKILGEMMMLIEGDKRDKKYALKLTYAEDEEDRFYVPPNVYIIGTMNTADRSLAIVDYALRRRFAFVGLRPEFGEVFSSFLRSSNISESLIGHIQKNVRAVNERIKQDPNLGEGFQIGHSFFCGKQDGQEEEVWWDEIVESEIKPLLKEIYFDNDGTVNELLTKLTYNNGNSN
jgi:5-methylcytosine-specific restriction protein B